MALWANQKTAFGHLFENLLSREDFRCKKDLISISLSSNDLNHLDEDIFADLLQITSIQLSIKDFNSSKRLIRFSRNDFI